MWQASDAGPKDQWPIGMGFDYFYGFIGGDMDQWHPTIYENINQLFPDEGHPHYNFNVDMADKAIAWLKRINDLKPEQPVFLYYAPGATHAPHQPTAEWIAKFKGKFDMGWENYREMAFKRMQAMSIIPKNAKLTPWPDPKSPDYANAGYADIALQHWDGSHRTKRRDLPMRWKSMPPISPRPTMELDGWCKPSKTPLGTTTRSSSSSMETTAR